VDARDRLRQYLEQRRELGEDELVLDRMSVEDLMRVLGASEPRQSREAGTGSPAATRSETADRASGSANLGEFAEPIDAGHKPVGAEPVDWRQTLRAAGVEQAGDAGGGGGATAGTGDEAMAKERRTASPKVTGDRARDAATARRASAERGRSDEGMDRSSAPGAATPEAGEGRKAPRPTPAGRSAGSAGADFGAPEGLSVGGAVGELFGGPFAQLDSLDAIAAAVAKCKRCPLYATAKNPVPGEGNPNAELVCVGEAPGANEDESGRPFVGQAGQLLTKILAAIKLAREDVFIANVLKHRPPNNRNPKPDEVEACSPYLVRQLELIRPKVIVAFGTFAAQTLLDTKLSIGKLRGAVHRYYGIPLVVTYHPAALLRNPSWKRPTWEDVQLARRILDRVTAA
jgi:uracil-DNA glycosylase